MNTGCLLCGGTGFMIDGSPCPNCSKEKEDCVPVFDEIPVQYQGLVFDKELLPNGMQEPYGTFMEDLRSEILRNISTFQRNMLICCRPNCGKSVWAYNIYSKVRSNGVDMPPIKDIVEVNQILSLTSKDLDLAKLYSNSRLAIIKIPRKVNPDILDSMFFIIDRRVRNNGCTIFLYDGQRDDLKNQDYYGKLKYLLGNGSFNTLKAESFYEKKTKGE